MCLRRRAQAIGRVRAQREKPKGRRAEGSEGVTARPWHEASEHPVLHRNAHGITLGLLGHTVSV